MTVLHLAKFLRNKMDVPSKYRVSSAPEPSGIVVNVQERSGMFWNVCLGMVGNGQERSGMVRNV